MQANYLASPPLVVAYALAGTVQKDLTKEPIGNDKDGNPVYLKDIWPTSKEIQEFILKYVTRELYETKYADVFKGDENWQAVQVPPGQTYAWDDNSTYVQNPPYFVGMGKTGSGLKNIKGARVLSVSLATRSRPTIFLRPVDQGGIACRCLSHRAWRWRCDFNQYGTRRGNHEVMMRGTFANIRIRNHMLGPNGKEGGYTIHYPQRKRCRSTTRP